jgi:hypothetical protein
MDEFTNEPFSEPDDDIFSPRQRVKISQHYAKAAPAAWFRAIGFASLSWSIKRIIRDGRGIPGGPLEIT